MLARFAIAVISILVAADQAIGQTVRIGASNTGASNTPASAWHRAGEAPTPTSAPTPAAASSTETPRRPIARVSKGDGTLPNKHGQVWREYDISPYTARVTSTKRPEQALVDWILLETGYEVWHGEPLGVLSATRRKLRVYHTPKMQAVVANLVDRFVASEAETCTFSLRVVTLDHPNWRAKAQKLLRPVAVQTPGVSAWVLEKEDAAVLLSELGRRSDYRQHSSPHLWVNNGQSTVVSAMRTRNYVRGVTLRNDVWPGFKAESDQIDEGFALEFAPLLSVDRRMIDAVIKCNIDQVEKMVPVTLEIPTQAWPRQRTRIEVPQITHFRFHERFRWPTGQVLLVGMGMVALPVPVDASAKMLVPGIPLPLVNTAPLRADLLVFIEAKGKTAHVAPLSRTPRRQTAGYRGRF